MNEILEAERFCKELDCLLAGTKGGDPLDEESAKDMEFAERIVSSDRSGESKVRRSLKAKLLARKPGRLEAWGVRPWVLCAGLATLILVPLAIPLIIREYEVGRVAEVTAYIGDLRGAQERNAARSAAAQSNSLGYVSKMLGYAGVGSSGPTDGSANSLAALKKAAKNAGNAINRQGSALSAAEQAAGMNIPGGAGVGGAGNDSKSLGESLAYLSPRQTGYTITGNRRFGELSSGRALGGGSVRQLSAVRHSVAPKGNFSSLSGLSAPEPLVQPSQLPFSLSVDQEVYNHMAEGEFLKASNNPFSTFSIDVDVASYANVRRFLKQDRLPPPDAVRIEEFINYFRYDYPEPQHGQPFTIIADAADSPWHAKHKLVRVAIKAKSIPKDELPPSNLVFLIDSSGSMQDGNKLPLVKKALRLLVNELRPQDHVAIVTYASSAGIVLDATSGIRKADILAAIDRLQADGSTAGAQGIQLAYQVAAKHLLKKGNNRVILATDGDFNVGVTSDSELVRLIEGERTKGIFLTVLGVGEGNYQDAKMQQLADKGNGNYAYLDDIAEAQKVLVAQLAGTLNTVAKDVKIQVEFNPARVQAYRLIGYEKRALQAEDFKNDKKDAGELGSGHTVTALYEVIPPGVKTDLPAVDELRYQKTSLVPAEVSHELLTVKVRYKDPNGTKSLLMVRPLVDKMQRWSEAAPDFKFAAAVAGFGMLLRGSAFSRDLSYDKVYRMAQASGGKDPDGTRGEFIRLVEKARLLKGL
ncbi:MAG: VWA domain-containing protein [Elusimicrobia bacterium]|nr:VWA domain-containing protein [Elusimicrobiota bacterium]